MMKHAKSPAAILFGLSLAALVITAYVTVTQNTVFNIAGTQWVLVAIVLAVYAVYAQSCSCNIDKGE